MYVHESDMALIASLQGDISCVKQDLSSLQVLVNVIHTYETTSMQNCNDSYSRH